MFVFGISPHFIHVDLFYRCMLDISVWKCDEHSILHLHKHVGTVLHSCFSDINHGVLFFFVRCIVSCFISSVNVNAIKPLGC